MRWILISAALTIVLTGCPTVTTTQARPDGTTTTKTQIDSGEAMRVVMNYARERSKLTSRVNDEKATPAARLDAQQQIDAMDGALGLAAEIFAKTLSANNRIVVETDAQGRTVLYLEPIRTAAHAPGMVKQ